MTEHDAKTSERIAIPRPASNRPRKEPSLGKTMPLSTRSGGVTEEMFT